MSLTKTTPFRIRIQTIWHFYLITPNRKCEWSNLINVIPSSLTFHTSHSFQVSLFKKVSHPFLKHINGIQYYPKKTLIQGCNSLVKLDLAKLTLSLALIQCSATNNCIQRPGT